MFDPGNLSYRRDIKDEGTTREKKMQTTTATELAHDVFARLDSLYTDLDEQVLVSQNRWVDHLLDLYNLLELPSLRRVVEDTLSDLRFRGSVEAFWMMGQLETLAAAVEIEAAFDSTAALPH
jgi:hypothetical protein